jgi:hypothetical protein
LQLIGFVEAVLLELANVLVPFGMILVEGVGTVGKGAGVMDLPQPPRPKPASVLRSAKLPSPKREPPAKEPS